jgi:hypothetical protein
MKWLEFPLRSPVISIVAAIVSASLSPAVLTGIEINRA